MIRALIILLLIATPATAQPWLLEHTGLAWNATLVPPHNEPVVGDRVARYRIQLAPSLDTTWLRYRLEVNAWGVNRWQPSSVVGNGIPDAWQGSDWTVDMWRVSLLHRLEAGPRPAHLYVEHYQPVDRHSWGGHGLERHYYWLVGVGGRL